MKYLLILLTALALTAGLGTVALAQNAPDPSGADTSAACALGTCKVPMFSAVGEKAVYKGGSGPVVSAADCCIAGDTYKLWVKNSSGTITKVKFTSSGSLDGSCSVFPHPDTRSLSVASAVKSKLKAIALPGGVPAAAYWGANGSWTQVKLTDACSF